MKLLGIIIGMGLFFGASCEKYGSDCLERNITKLLTDKNVSAAELSCSNDFKNRYGLCVFSADEKQVEDISNNLNLREMLLKNEKFIYMASVKECNEKSLTLENSDVVGFRRPLDMKFEDGQSIKEFSLFYNLTSKKACVYVQFSSS